MSKKISIRHSRSGEQHSGERGAVLILAAIFALVLVGYAFFAIATNLIHAGWSEAKVATRLAALTAAREFFASRQTDSSPCTTYVCSMDAAVVKVNEVSSANTLVGSSNNNAPLVYWGTQNPQNALAELVGGWWFASQEVCQRMDDLLTSADLGCGSLQYPDFVPYPVGSVPDNIQPNAFEVSGYFHPEGLTVLKMLGGVTGMMTLKLPTNAIASFTPRLVMVGGDLSPSAAASTHFNWTYFGPFIDIDVPPQPELHCCPVLADVDDPLKRQAHGNRSAYVTREDNCNCVTGSDCCPFGTCNNLLASADSCLGGSQFVEIYEPMDRGWYMLNSDTPLDFYNWPTTSDKRDLKTRDTDPPSPDKHHFGDDYVQRYVVGDDDYTAIVAASDSFEFEPSFHPLPEDLPAGEGFFVQNDYYRSAQYSGPQPLTRIILGVRNALGRFRDTRVPGDSAGMFFFDNTTDWRKFVKMDVDNLDYLIEFLNVEWGALDPEANDVVPNPMTTLDDYDKDSSTWNYDPRDSGKGIGYGLDRLTRLGTFPGRFVYSDLRMAITFAGREIIDEQEETLLAAQENIVLFTDGLHNCPTPGTCSNSLASYNLAHNDLLSFISQVQQAGSPDVPPSRMHFIMFGDHVGPHTALIRNPLGPADTDRILPNGTSDYCMRDEDFRQSPVYSKGESLFVVPGNNNQSAWNGMLSGTTPFFHANRAPYLIAATSDGLFGPIRERAPECDSDILGAHGGAEEVLTSPIDGTQYLNPKKFHPLCVNTYVNPSADVASSAGGLTAQNRMMFDPYCRSKSEQIRQYLDKIMGSNPFAIVRSG